MSADTIQAYYAGFGDKEWTRLTTPIGAIEFAVHKNYIASHLPEKAHVLDIGGGPGRYSIWLAEQGHTVVLADLSPHLLDLARAHIAESPAREQVKEIVQTDVRDLSHWADETFDAVLCLGPFYHLIDPTDRDRAARELARVCKRGAPIFIALMPRYVFIRRTMSLPDEVRHLNDRAWVSRVLDEGVFVNDVPGRFPLGYGIKPDEVAGMFEPYGFEMDRLVSSEGLSLGIEQELAELAKNDPALYQKSLDLIIQTAADPSIPGTSSHLLYVGHKV